MGFLSFLSKVFRYENENGESLTFTYENGFVINKPVGIDTLTVSLSQATGINQVGATVQSANIQPRPVNISGILVGQFIAENKGRLLSVIRPDLKGKLFADDYFLDVLPTATPTIGPQPDFAKFSFSVLAVYPYWQKKDGRTIPLSGVEYLFKFPWNMSRAYQFGRRIASQFITVRNSGNMPVPFTLTFQANGICINPKLTNVNTGKFLQINKEMADGERIVIQITHGRTYVISSVDGNVRGCLSLQSNLNRLDVGDNVLKPEAEEGEESMDALISFAPELVGVSV